jgi:hypothetical protein
MTTHADNLWSLSLSQGLSALKTLVQGQISPHFRQPDNNFYIAQKGKYFCKLWYGNIEPTEYDAIACK